MDFEQLYNLLPKQSVTWTVADIEVWLQFIGLSSYAPQFKSASVDGSCLSALTEDDIHQQLKITSKIITKKIMTWIKQGVQHYDEYLLSREKALKQSSLPKKYYKGHRHVVAKAFSRKVKEFGKYKNGKQLAKYAKEVLKDAVKGKQPHYKPRKEKQMN